MSDFQSDLANKQTLAGVIQEVEEKRIDELAKRWRQVYGTDPIAPRRRSSWDDYQKWYISEIWNRPAEATTTTVFNMPYGVAPPATVTDQDKQDDDDISRVLAWPKWKKATLYKFLHDIDGFRMDNIEGIIRRKEV